MQYQSSNPRIFCFDHVEFDENLGQYLFIDGKMSYKGSNLPRKPFNMEQDEDLIRFN